MQSATAPQNIKPHLYLQKHMLTSLPQFSSNRVATRIDYTTPPLHPPPPRDSATPPMAVLPEDWPDIRGTPRRRRTEHNPPLQPVRTPQARRAPPLPLPGLSTDS